MPANKQLIKLLHENIRSIRKRTKFQELYKNLQQNTPIPDVIIISETWLAAGQETTYNLDGYNRISCARGTRSRGGGILVFVRDNYVVETMNESKMAPDLADNITF